MPPRSFRIDVPESDLDDLRHRLEQTRWPEPIPGSGWDYGAGVGYLRSLCDYWRTEYDWRFHERVLNTHPQYLCEVDGVDIHYWHVRGEGSGPLPLLLIHGWPGSIVEFLDVMGPLSAPAAFGASGAPSFDLVIPSLPGFGFGGKPREPGWGVSRIAAAFHSLMTRELGYSRYAVQGGDWGGIIGAKMASQFGSSMVGAHLNFVIAMPPGEMNGEEKAFWEQRNRFQAQETAYSNVQGTKPDSLTVAQSDSPAGLAAWIIEKFRAWSDCGGDVERAFTRDQLLTNLMFYWLPNSAASAARIYYESMRDPGAFFFEKVETPTGVAVFPEEPWRVPRRWAEARFNVVRWTEMPRGGHFAAMEEPALLVDDIRAFFAELTA
ncbi:MAG: epoxide hydrolase [Dehalococcoidia bacterium]|nr:epoxide hydrolase [Dehalococcoidia bacterium]NUQ54523.1 epoxide hydrolase [Dehalococcoidia bacterium]